MAEPISLASGLITLAAFAFQASITLFKTVQSFQFHPKRVRDLTEELEALSGVLSSLVEMAGAAPGVDLSALDLPLLRCGNACKDFEQEILKCSSRSGGTRTSFRDWAKLRYMGDGIDDFRQLLAGYKSTINIALTDANLRKTSVTADTLELYRELIQTATDDLEAHLQSIDEKLETILGRAVTQPGSNAAELKLMQEERISAQKCLQICAQLSDHIDQIQVIPSGSGSPIGSAHSDMLPEKLTAEGLQQCKESLRSTAAKLERYMADRINRLVTQCSTTMTAEDRLELRRLQEEWETSRQCVNICAQAELHLREEISTIENYATGDAVQFMVSTGSKTIHGRNRGLGWRTRQVGGHMSDVSVQQLSRDMSRTSLKDAGMGVPSFQGDPREATDDGAATEHGSAFRDRHGPGMKLKSKSKDIPTLSSPGPAAEVIPSSLPGK